MDAPAIAGTDAPLHRPLHAQPLAWQESVWILQAVVGGNIAYSSVIAPGKLGQIVSLLHSISHNAFPQTVEHLTGLRAHDTVVLESCGFLNALDQTLRFRTEDAVHRQNIA